MNLKQLTAEVDELYYNDSTSYKTITSIQKELLVVLDSETDIKNINIAAILKYFKYLKSNNNKPSTINNKMMYLSKLLNYAFKNNLIKSKPLIPTIKNKNKETVTISETEFKQMLDYSLNNHKIELYQVLIIGYNTGMRISNILSLKPDNIDNDYIRIWRNKTNTPYSIPMNNTLKELLKDFTGFNINYRQIQYQFNTMIKKLNLDTRITIHTLRHTTCSRLIEKGVSLPVVQKIMNHKNIQTTMIYTHIKNKQLENAINLL